ncbi:GNAT family N-acetyltransferase [Kribbella sp. NPDC051952]|uniref:GNAT family N-acetyltransferase n=1 Tax=Kribbella sp. NPDC051952 TaxID=3154851 RepID=UPI003418170B
MNITRLSPDDEVGIDDAVAVIAAAEKLDCPESVVPTPRGYAAKLKHGWDGEPPLGYLARDDDGVPVGVLTVDTPTYDNKQLAWAGIQVHPDHRRRGIGSTLLEHAEGVARELGRTSFGTDNWDLPKANAFSLKHGFEQKAIEVNRRQDIAGLDWSVVDRLYDEAVQASTEYELLRITGRLPEEMLDGMVALVESINDAPTDDLDIEDDVYSPERLRAYETAMAAHDVTVYRVIARKRSTGELAGHSVIAVERERPHIGEQHDTAVDRKHRGHRLGALVKTDMLRWLREAEPALAQVDTWNAESNGHMIAINEQLNYRIVARAIAYQKTL